MIRHHNESMLGSPRIGRSLAIVVIGASSVASCSSSDTVTSPTTTNAPSVVTTSTTTTLPPTTSSVPVETTTTTTVLESTTTSTEPLAVEELVLRGDGIGAALFGADPDEVINYVTSIIGGDTDDTGWVDPFTFSDCGGGGAATVARRVEWGVLALLFSDGSAYGVDRRHFIGFEYGRVGQIGDEPQGLRTPGGTTLGSRVSDLLVEFPDAGVYDGEADLGIPATYYVSDVFQGLLTGTGPDDVVTVMFGGHGCG